MVGGRYRLLAPVGTGASADVYVADDITLRRRVAVKVLHDALAVDEGFLHRFRAEARAVASLRHANIMAVFDWGEEVDGPFLVLEYLGGGSVRDLLDRGFRLTPSQAVLVGIEAARGLDYAHRRGLVHRDIKPANLLFDDEGRLAIADFGIARALAEATWTEPAGAVVGTVRYASPEQARGNSIDGRADVYALALVLVEAVTGRVPFGADTTIATLMARLDRPIPAASADLGALAGVIEAAGTVDPDQRVDAAGLLHALDAAARQLPRPAALPISPAAQLPMGPVNDVRVARAGGVDATTVFAPVGKAGTTGPAGGAGAATGAAAGADAPEVVRAATGPVAAPGGEAVVFDQFGPLDQPGPLGPAPAAPRRWWLWAAALALMVLLGVAAGIVLPSLLRPTYAVPNLVGQSQAAAEGRHPHFRVVVHAIHRTGMLGTVLDQNPRAGTHRRGGVITVEVATANTDIAVPPLAGDTVAKANAALTAVDMVPGTPRADFSDTVPAGVIVDWNPKTTGPERSVVDLVVSKGPQFVTMPDVVTSPQPVAQALAALAGAGIDPATVTQTQDFNDTVPKGDVISTTPPAGGKVDRAAAVMIDVSKGPQMVKVPDVTGDSVSQATTAIENQGLTVSSVFGPHDGTVFGEKPQAGTSVKVGSSVELGAL